MENDQDQIPSEAIVKLLRQQQVFAKLMKYSALASLIALVSLFVSSAVVTSKGAAGIAIGVFGSVFGISAGMCLVSLVGLLFTGMLEWRRQRQERD